MVLDKNTALEEEPVPVMVDQLPAADLQPKQSPAQRDIDPIELGNIQIDVSNEVDQSAAPHLRVEQSRVAYDSKYVIQVTVALALVGGSFTVMLAVPGGVNKVGRAVMGDTIAFNIFLVANMLAFHASLVVGMIVATVSHMSADIDYLVRITLWAAAVCFDLAFHAAAYVVVLPYQRWIVLCFGGAITIELVLLVSYRLFTIFYQVCGKEQQGTAT